MKKIIVTAVLIGMLSCGSNCKIDSAKITSLSAEITVLEQKISETNLEPAKAIYQSQIDDIKQQITIEAQKCE